MSGTSVVRKVNVPQQAKAVAALLSWLQDRGDIDPS